MKSAIGRKPTLADVEKALAEQELSLDSGPAEVWLSRETGPKFFVDSRVVALLLTLARSRGVQVVDWSGQTLGNWRNRFGTTITGLAATAYSPDVKTNAGRFLDIDFTVTKQEIDERDGLAENEETESSKVKTYCAFDDDYLRKQPLAFATAVTKDDFCDEFDSRIHPTEWLFGGRKPGADAPERRIAEFAFELFQNTAEHGSMSKAHHVMRGLRFLQIRRHIATSKSRLLERAETFLELREFLSSSVTGSDRDIRFCEVTVGDQGVGIVDRLVATRPDLVRKATSWKKRATFVNEIIQSALTSKVGVPGAGHGLERVLESLDVLSGFISLRTGDLWMYYAGREGTPPSKRKLLDVGSRSWPFVQGTHVSILFRLG